MMTILFKLSVPLIAMAVSLPAIQSAQAVDALAALTQQMTTMRANNTASIDFDAIATQPPVSTYFAMPKGLDPQALPPGETGMDLNAILGLLGQGATQPEAVPGTDAKTAEAPMAKTLVAPEAVGQAAVPSLGTSAIEALLANPKAVMSLVE